MRHYWGSIFRSCQLGRLKKKQKYIKINKNIVFILSCVSLCLDIYQKGRFVKQNPPTTHPSTGITTLVVGRPTIEELEEN